MKQLPPKELTFTCPVDLEAFMYLSQNKRVDHDLALRVGEFWQKWIPFLKAYKLGEKKGYVLVYLENEVEEEINRIWDESPSTGFEAQCVAQTMIMQTMRELFPELAAAGCAPVPTPNKILKRSLEPLGLTFDKSGGMNVKYAMLTPFPFKSGCEPCYLSGSCPNKTWTLGKSDQS